MRILSSIAAAGLLLAAPAALPAQTSAVPDSAPSLSEDGKKAFQAMAAQRRTDMAPLLKRKAELEAQFDGLLTPATYDAAKLRTIMDEMQAVEGAIFKSMGGSMLTLLEALPEADRAQFMKSITKTPPAQATGSR